MKIIRKVNFDVCTFCNHKCTFCSNADPRTIKHQTSLDDFKNIMQNLTKHVEPSEIGLSAKGEVLVNNDFVAIVKSCKEDFDIPYVYFSTNGALLSDKKVNKLLEAGIDSIKFSINAVDAQAYNAVHLVDDFDLVINNFKNLLRLKKEKYPKLKISISSVINMQEDVLKEKFRALLGEDFDLVDLISVYQITYTSKFEEIASGKKVTKKCPIPFNEIYINSDGSLGLCCKDYFDEVNFGSLKENDFLDLYESRAFKKIRDMHTKSEFPDNHICKNCLLYGEE